MMARDIYDEAQRLLAHARKPQALEDAERKVIEAAKALHAKMNRGEFASTADEQAGVWQAVEALQEVEG